MATEVLNRQRLARIDVRRVASTVDAALGAVGRTGANLTVVFIRDRVIRKLNRRYRGHDRMTDVLSFPVDGETGAGDDDFVGEVPAGYLGDIVISTDTALRQANESRHTFERELDELLMHGVLHLCGYDHETDRGQMNRLELKLRRKLLDGKQ
ncbi:MAG: rRNA maturation RNase YbeY [Blastocatellia bacterium]